MAAHGTPADPIHDEDIVVSLVDVLRDLRTSGPASVAVAAALDRRDIRAAGRAYIAWFRTRPMDPDLFVDWDRRRREPEYDVSQDDGLLPRPVLMLGIQNQYTLEAADDLLAGGMWDGYNVCNVSSTGIDWRQGPLPCLTRLPVLGTMRHAMCVTGDAKYARWATDHILEYARNWPIEEFVGQGTVGWVDNMTVCRPWHWCMHPERVMELAHTLTLLREFDEVSDEELLTILRRVYQETAWIRLHMHEWVGQRHNGGLGMITGLAYGCALLDGFAAAEAWREYNAEMLARYIGEAFYPDGQCIEMTCAYSQMVTNQVQRLAFSLRERRAIQQMAPRLRAMVQWAVGLRRPTGLLPAFGDLYPSQFAHGIHRPLLDWLGIRYVGTFLGEQEAPLPPFLDWPPPGTEAWAGRYVMRSDWSREALYLCLHAGAPGISHQHGDKLSFVLSALGADFIIDPSSTRYRSNDPDAFISRQLAGFLHNTVTVDGVDVHLNEPLEVNQPHDCPWEYGEHFVYVGGRYRFAPALAAEWQRRIIFVDRTYWLLQDVITGEQPTARIEQNFQLEQGIAIELDGVRTICTAPNGARLLIVPLESGLLPELSIGDSSPRMTCWPQGERSEYPHSRGWTGHSGHALMPAPAVTYAGEIDLPAVLTLALIPIAPGGDPSALPAINSAVAKGQTVWTLPYPGGSVGVTTDVDRCEVAERSAP